MRSNFSTSSIEKEGRYFWHIFQSYSGMRYVLEFLPLFLPVELRESYKKFHLC